MKGKKKEGDTRMEVEYRKMGGGKNEIANGGGRNGGWKGGREGDDRERW